MVRTWNSEHFGCGADDVAPILSAAGWTDASWHNDACPRWVGPSGLVLWVDYVDPDARDCPGSDRFVLCGADDDADDAPGPVLMMSESFEAIRAAAGL